MSKQDAYFEIDGKTPKNPFILAKCMKYGGIRKLARKLGISPANVSLALNEKSITGQMKEKIAKHFNKSVSDIFD